MVRALRVVSVERGFNPGDFALVAFGGAGAMHACNLANELGISTVIVPYGAGVLSALGLAVSDVRRDYVSALLASLSSLRPATLESAFRAPRTAGDVRPGPAHPSPAQFRTGHARGAEARAVSRPPLPWTVF